MARVTNERLRLHFDRLSQSRSEFGNLVLGECQMKHLLVLKLDPFPFNIRSVNREPLGRKQEVSALDRFRQLESIRDWQIHDVYHPSDSVVLIFIDCFIRTWERLRGQRSQKN